MLARARDSEDPDLAAVVQAITGAIDSVDEADPFAGAHWRIRRDMGSQTQPSALLKYWASRSPGNPRGDMRYRWELSHRRGVRMPAYCTGEEQFAAWRPAEQELLEADPFAFEQRLVTPIVLTENVELLADAAQAGDPLAENLLAEAAPVVRRDFAGYVQALDPWRDTFALWCLTRQRHALGMLHPLAVGIATCYAASDPGPVQGIRFPFHRVPLASASAQLAASLLALGSDIELVCTLVEYLNEARLEGGGWGDATEQADVLTTLVAADLMVRVDPSFEFDTARQLLWSLRSPDGLWRAVGPDAPWLSAEILSLLMAVRQPFPHRFRWPYLPPANRDRKTRVPFFAYFADLAQLFAALPGLRRARVELGFVDLIGFRAFNNEFGQERGDAVLSAFAAALSNMQAAQTIRDGGDEFIVVGAPERRGLLPDLETFLDRWPRHFRELFGADVPPVAPRILVGHAAGRDLIAAREDLGKRITALKGREGADRGIVVDAGELPQA